jgi:phosphoglycolate phosphatase
MTEADFREQDRLYREEIGALPIHEGMKELVLELASQYTQAIVSSTHSDHIKYFCERHGIDECFFAIFGSDVGTEKSKKIRSLLETCNVRSRDAVFVTDTLGDIAEARLACVTSIAVTWGYHDVHTLRKGIPAAIVRTPHDLKATIHRYIE